MDRVRQALQTLPLPSGTVVGVGPKHSKDLVDFLRVVRVLASPEQHREILQRLFVTTAEATQSQELAKQWEGIIASSDPIVVLDRLQERFKESSVQIFYHADADEYGRFRDTLLLLGVQRFALMQRDTGMDLQLFLQEFLANLFKGVPYNQLPDQVNIRQLAQDVELLIRA